MPYEELKKGDIMDVKSLFLLFFEVYCRWNDKFAALFKKI